MGFKYATEEERKEGRRRTIVKYAITHREYYAELRAKNRDKYAAQKREFYMENKEYVLERNRKWRNSHPLTLEQRKARNIRNKQRRNELRHSIIVAMGSKCTACNFSDWRALQVDHIYGGGYKERKSIGWWGIAKKILAGNWQGQYQLLCANCNQIKRIENEEHCTVDSATKEVN